MKSLQCVELGPPDKLQIKEISDPQIIPDHVIIENKAASVNFPDVLSQIISSDFCSVFAVRFFCFCPFLNIFLTLVRTAFSII